jgi:Tol biopolymer transport system component
VALTPGTRLGAYEILTLIGSGGMGEVYRAKDTKLHRDVAIKVLPSEVAADPDRLARFEREAQVLASLNHPNIAHIHGVDDSTGVPALIMELVEGPTLADRIAKGPISLDEALPIAKQIAEALEAAHEKGIIHRDLKPANIAVTRDGAVKVLDFGLAKALDPTGAPNADVTMSPTLTAVSRHGVILGTAAYMSPEQARGKVVERRVDLWAFGAVVYEMLTGRRAFDGEDVSDTLAHVLMKEPDWSLLPVHTPISIRRLLRRCLEKDRIRRLESAADARLEIEETLTSSAYTDTDAVGSPGPPRQGVIWIGVLTLLIVAAAFALWTVQGRLAPLRSNVRRLTVSIPANQGFVDIPGNAVLFAPDGTAIVYSGRGTHGSQLYYRRLDQFEGIALPGTDNACCPAISPSGDWVAFEAEGAISKVSVHGGAAIGLAKVSYQGGLSWPLEDTIFSAEDAQGLFRIPANGGPPQRIAIPDRSSHETAWFMPMTSPDGKHVFILTYRDQRPHGIAMVRLADGQVTDLEGGAENPIGMVGGVLVFGRNDGTLGVAPFDPARTRSVEGAIPVLDQPLARNSGIEAALSAAGDLVYVRGKNRSKITFLDRQGQVIGIGSEERNFFWPRVSPDGKRIVLVDRSDNLVTNDLWLYDVASGVLQRLTTNGDSTSPEWTPDGQRVVYRLGSAKGTQIWSLPADRSAPPEQVFVAPSAINRAVLSPDSRYAVVSAFDSRTKSDLYLVDLKDDRKPQPLEQSPFNESSPAISPDGRWLAYVSDESGRSEIYIRPFPASGAHVLVSSDGGTDPRWEKDSRGIVYRSGDRFIRAALTAGATVVVTQRTLLFSYATGFGANYNYDLSPNGTIVALRPSSVEAELIVVANWVEEIKAQVLKK